MRKQLIWAATIVAAITGCADMEDALCEVKIAPSIQTRVAGLNFEQGDCIGVTIVRASGDYVRNRMMSYDGAIFSASGLLWYNDQGEKSTLMAYYPYTSAGVPERFVVAADQSGGCEPSDLLVARRTDVTPASAAVGLTFRHVLSQLTVVVANNSSATVSNVIIGGLVPVALVDFESRSASAASDVAVSNVTMLAVTPGVSYRTVVVPQQAELTVCVRMSDGIDRSKSLPAALLESGKRYDMAVKVTDIDISVTLSGDIEDWEPGGDLGEDSDTPGLEYQGVTYRTVAAGGRIWMAENLCYVPTSATIGNGIWYPNQSGAAGDSDAYVRMCGMLYNYATASEGGSGSVVRGICPEGWHLPDGVELAALVADAGYDFSGFASGAGGWNATAKRYIAAGQNYILSTTPADDEGRHSCLHFLDGASRPSIVPLLATYGISVRCVKNLK